MMARGSIRAEAFDGQVFITVDPQTARDLGEAFAAAYAGHVELEAGRPTWFLDVAALMAAAYEADVQNGCSADTVPVPFFPKARPSLMLVGGGEPA